MAKSDLAKEGSLADLSGYFRSSFAMGAIGTAFGAGLGLKMLSGSTRDATNFGLGLFGDLSSAFAGIELVIQGEENLWKSRPAIFIFNHQSIADGFVIVKLVRKDLAGVGKKEIGKVPFLKQITSAAGLVLIDRSRSKDAITAMQPLVDAIKNENKSIVIAPEGTRSVDGTLLPFKKGAFHLAIQAGVPVVPIVLHNTAAIMPKGKFGTRPGKVKVEVLAPVDTSKWKSKTVQNHVDEVRALFLNALGS
ncbi:hypothetical protein A8B75_01255 [Sphingomonadales bacterium EhC05]|nr:hypothetical protein A8B75_01255 [Sphingomonadales bacterium EhC05]